MLPLTTSIIMTADLQGRVVETIHVINKPGQEPQTKITTSLTDAMNLAGSISDEIEFKDVNTNVSRQLTKDLYAHPAHETVGAQDCTSHPETEYLRKNV